MVEYKTSHLKFSFLCIVLSTSIFFSSLTLYVEHESEKAEGIDPKVLLDMIFKSEQKEDPPEREKPFPEYQHLLKNGNGTTDVIDGYAVLAGVSDYPGTSYDLDYCDDDVNDMYALVKNQFHIPDSNIITLIDSQATIPAITNAINNMSSRMDSNDYLYFYFSGHGSSANTTSTYSWNIESPHPYPNNYDNYWHYSAPGADMMRVHFVTVNTENNYDYVDIGDYHEPAYYWDYFDGYWTNVWSYWVMTDDIYVRLTSDSTITDWGFEADQVQAAYWVAPQEIIPYDGLSAGLTGPELDTILDSVPGSSVAVMDTCHSGGVGSAIQAVDRYIMTACTDQESSLEDSTYHNGCFTYNLLNAWGPAQDINDDGTVSFEEAFAYAYPNTVSRSTSIGYTHHPVEYDGITGELSFEPNAKIYSVVNDSSNNIAVNYTHSGLGSGEIVCAYYDITNTNYSIEHINSTLLGMYGSQQLNVNAPGGGFIPSGVTTILNARYHDYLEGANYSLELGGVTFSNLTDSDSDGLFDLEEYYYGTNPWLNDTDSDGLSDLEEKNLGLNPYVNDSFFDYDRDYIPNFWEFFWGLDPFVSNLFTDQDSDLAMDSDEFLIGSNLTNPDTDGDGMGDGWEWLYSPWVNITDPTDIGLDPDADGLINSLECTLQSNPGTNDTDGDGMDDAWEYYSGLNILINDANGDFDGDGAPNIGEYLHDALANNTDTDGDGMGDGWEWLYSPWVNITDPTDTGLDPDADGLINSLEYTLQSNPGTNDTDGDGMDDEWEYYTGLYILINDSNGDFDSDGVPNLGEYLLGALANDTDSDNDGMGDGWEWLYSPWVNITDPSDSFLDPDNDTLQNYLEFSLNSNPGSNDSDSDGMVDEWEYNSGLNVIVDDATDDLDDDGISNLGEYQMGALANCTDSDGDSMLDNWEYFFSAWVNITDPSDQYLDPDNDGLNNMLECQLNSNPGSADTDGDGMPDIWEFCSGLNLNVNDAWGDLDADGLVNLIEFQIGAYANYSDTDGDGLNDYQEFQLGTSPVDTDSDGDMFSDYLETILFNDPANSGDSPIIHFLIFGIVIVISLLMFASSKRLAKKKKFKRPSLPGPRPKEKSKPTEEKRTRPSYSYGYGARTYTPSYRSTTPSYRPPAPRYDIRASYPRSPALPPLPYEIQRRLNQLPPREREFARALIMEQLKQKLIEELKRLPAPFNYCVKCGGRMEGRYCPSCGFIYTAGL